eukprot:TRINITY_DN872_c1_g2_i1.p1 TRINITY_DN872_c1_g2~~TRINITY_DN872_c1_g2_i1.p1  ORF type:complete len:732 (+),score=254.08 TRINITY_DN872_c1_g2_i1:46-2241(+)
MGGAASLDVDRRKFAVCVAADLYGRKSNVRFVFGGCPVLPQLLEACTMHYSYEMNAVRPAGAPEHPFQVEQMHVYDPPTRRWLELMDPASQLRPGAQVFAFQPRMATTLGVSFDHPSVIPEAVGEATVLGVQSLRIDYSLEHKLRAVYLAIDRGDKGYVLPGDLHDCLARAGMPWDYSLVGEYFNMVNTSANGRLTYAQWARFGREHPDVADEIFHRSRSMPPTGPGSFHLPPPQPDVQPPLAASLSATAPLSPRSSVRSMAPPRSAALPTPAAGGHAPAAAWQRLAAGRANVPLSELRTAFAAAAIPWDGLHAGAWASSPEPDARVGWAEWWLYAQQHPKEAAALARGGPPPAPTPTVSLPPLLSAVAMATWDRLSRGRGYAVYSDLRGAMIAAGQRWDALTVGAWFHAADADSSGHVTLDEWLSFAQRHPAAVEALAHGGAAQPADPSAITAVWQTLAGTKGFIGYTELRAAMHRVGLVWDFSTVGRWSHASEMDGGGRVTWDEWWSFGHRSPGIVAALAGSSPLPPPPPSHPADGAATQVWQTVSSGKGFITYTDLRTAFFRAGQRWEAAVVGPWFTAADTDSSGRITWDEWWHFAQTHPSVVDALSRGNVPLRSSVDIPASRTHMPPHQHSVAVSVWSGITSGKGFATVADIRLALLRAGQPWDAATVGRCFHAADSDASGHVTLDEWLAFSQRFPDVVTALDLGSSRKSTGSYSDAPPPPPRPMCY